MKPTFRIFLFSFLLIGIMSCKKEKNPPILTINPSYLILAVDAGKVIQFQLKASSENAFNRLLITSKLDNDFTKTELDSVLIPTKSLNHTFEYKALAKASDYNLILNFRIFDQDGNEAVASRKLEVKVSSAPLQEYAGNEFFSNYSGKPDAYNLITRSPIFSDVSPDSEKHLLDAQSDPGTPTTLSKSWISPAGGQFVVFNGFDYVNASKTSLLDAYNSGTKLNKVVNLQPDQIILKKLVKDGVEHYFAIKIMQMIDDEGAENDRYIFNIKQ